MGRGDIQRPRAAFFWRRVSLVALQRRTVFVSRLSSLVSRRQATPSFGFCCCCPCPPELFATFWFCCSPARAFARALSGSWQKLVAGGMRSMCTLYIITQRPRRQGVCGCVERGARWALKKLPRSKNQIRGPCGRVRPCSSQPGLFLSLWVSLPLLLFKLQFSSLSQSQCVHVTFIDFGCTFAFANTALSLVQSLYQSSDPAPAAPDSPSSAPAAAAAAAAAASAAAAATAPPFPIAVESSKAVLAHSAFSFSSAAACGQDGLPSDGEDDCVACCFGSDSPAAGDLGSDAAQRTTAALGTLLGTTGLLLAL